MTPAHPNPETNWIAGFHEEVSRAFNYLLPLGYVPQFESMSVSYAAVRYESNRPPGVCVWAFPSRADFDVAITMDHDNIASLPDLVLMNPTVTLPIPPFGISICAAVFDRTKMRQYLQHPAECFRLLGVPLLEREAGIQELLDFKQRSLNQVDTWRQREHAAKLAKALEIAFKTHHWQEVIRIGSELGEAAGTLARMRIRYAQKQLGRV